MVGFVEKFGNLGWVLGETKEVMARIVMLASWNRTITRFSRGKSVEVLRRNGEDDLVTGKYQGLCMLDMHEDFPNSFYE
ncbi:MAG: hypothetical protein HPY71_12540 [Firmicutes bacterium]|nr:hypothetical protein [Bacillota bacterium]